MRAQPWGARTGCHEPFPAGPLIQRASELHRVQSKIHQLGFDNEGLRHYTPVQVQV